MKNSRKRAVLAGIALLAATALAACSSTPGGDAGDSGQVYRFGVLIPLTGANATVGIPMQQGVELEVDRVNSSGELPDGVQIQPVFVDNQADPTKTVSAFNQLITTQDVFASITSYSGPTLAVAPVAERAKIPLVNNGGVTPNLAGASSYLFNGVPLITQQALATLNYAITKEGLKKVALFYSSNDLGTGTAAVFGDMVKSLGGEDVGDVQFDPTSTQWRLELAKLQSLKPDAVFVTSTASGTGNIISQAASAGFNPVWMGYQAFGHPDTVKIGGDSAEGSFFSTPSTLDPATKKVYDESQRLADAYNQKFNTTGLPDFTVFTSALAVQLFAHSVSTLLENGDKVTGENVRNTLADTADFSSVLGQVTFQKDGTVLLPLEIRKVENGEFKNVLIYSLEDLEKIAG